MSIKTGFRRYTGRMRMPSSWDGGPRKDVHGKKTGSGGCIRDCLYNCGNGSFVKYGRLAYGPVKSRYLRREAGSAAGRQLPGPDAAAFAPVFEPRGWAPDREDRVQRQ